MAASLFELVCKTDSLPARPAVAMEVLRLTRREDSTVDDLIRVIQADAALTARILKVVNSSLFGMPRKIASVRQALVALGQRSVRMMAVSLSLVDAVRKVSDSGDAFDPAVYWRRSLSIAVASRLLASLAAPRQMEEAFVAGLLADIGIAAAWHTVRDRYEPALRECSASKRPLQDVEMERLGVTHAVLSAGLLRTWGLPDLLCDTVAAHHGQGLERLSGAALQMARIVQAAAQIAAVFCRDVPTSEMDAIRKRTLAALGVSEAALEQILKGLDRQVRDAAAMFSLHVAEAVDYSQVASKAAEELAELSGSAEAERQRLAEKEKLTAEQIHRLQHATRTYRAAAATDWLTRVANRAAFEETLEQELENARLRDYGLGLVLLDIDNLSAINDGYGHPAGDVVLREVAERLRDITDRVGFVARFGGEEFAVIVARATGEELRALAEEMRAAIEGNPFVCEGAELQVTASFGVASTQPRREVVTSEALVARADRHLLAAKRRGRNRVETGEDGPPASGFFARLGRLFVRSSRR